MISKLAAALAAAALLATAGCGSSDSKSSSGSSSDSSRPSASQVSSTLQKGITVSGKTVKVPKTQADCVSKKLVASKLSDKAVKAFASGDSSYKPTAADEKAITAFSKDASTCVKKQ